MSTFLRILNSQDKKAELLEAVRGLNKNSYSVEPAEFRRIEGSPFAYWISDKVRQSFADMRKFSDGERAIKQGIATADDFRFVRNWWELSAGSLGWVTFAKGGAFSPYYAPQNLLVNWKKKWEGNQEFC